MDYEDKVVEKLIEKLVTVQRESREEVSLESVAYEIGLSNDDVKMVKKQISIYLESGDRYLQNNCFQDAIIEYENALALNPFDPDILYKTANAYKFYWLGTKKGKHYTKAVELVKKCIELSPSHNEGYQMLGYLREKERKTSNQNRRFWIFMGGFAVLAVAMVVLYLVFPDGTDQPTVSTITDTFSAETSSPESSNSVSEVSEVTPPRNRVEVIFKENDFSEGFEFVLQISKLNTYSDSFSYNLKGALINSKYEINELQARMVWYDEAGSILFENFYDLLYSSYPNIRPGESVPVDILVYEDNQDPPPVAYTEIEVYYLEKSDPPSAYDSMKTLDYQWKAGARNHDLVIYERSSDIRSGTDKIYNYIEYVIENNGPKAVTELVLLTEWFNTEGSLVGTERSIVISSTDAGILSGQKRVYREIGSFSENQDLTGYTYSVSVIEIE